MATQIYLGNPPEKIKKWIKEEAERKYQEMLKTPLHFTANKPNSSVSLIAYDWQEDGQCDSWCSFVYSTDEMKTWNDYLINSTDDKDKIIQLDNCENKTVYFKAKYGNIEDNPNKNGLATYTYDEEDGYDANKYHQFVMEGSIKAGGNIQFLLDNTGSRMDVTPCCYCSVFKGCAALEQAPELPATTLADGCYDEMFFNCSALTQAPKLPATTLAEYCYMGMFNGCSSLTQVPELPAMTLAEGCYHWMFFNCTSLTQAPELPATELADSCYECMFGYCTSLTSAPELPAKNLTYACYTHMFEGCSALAQAPELPATTLAKSCYECMFLSCESLTKAPELPATKLANYCYINMFQNCTTLTKAPELPATELTESCYGYMFQNCKSPFTFPDKSFDEIANLIQEQILIGDYWYYYDEEGSEIVINPIEIICSDKTMLATFDENEYVWVLTEK